MSSFIDKQTTSWTRAQPEEQYVPPPALPILLQENGDPILQEDGNYILVES